MKRSAKESKKASGTAVTADAKPATTDEPAAADKSPPKWIAVCGAIVAVVALLWTIVSYFIPKPDPPKRSPAAVEAPAPSAPASAPTPSVSVDIGGSGNVGIGTVSGGQVTIDAKPVMQTAPAQAPSAGTGQAKK